MLSLMLLSLPFPTLNVHVTQKRWRYLIYLDPRIKLKTIVGTEIRSIQQTKIQCLAVDEKLPGRKISRKVQAIKQRKISHQNQPKNDTNGRFKRQGHFNSYHHHYILFKETRGKLSMLCLNVKDIILIPNQTSRCENYKCLNEKYTE